MTSQQSISVVIRAFNSRKTLPHLLRALRRAPGDSVIVVDSGSTDSTVALAESFGAVALHAPAPFNYSKSLNIGFQAATGDWVLVISSHCIPIVDDILSIFRREAATLPGDVVVAYAPSTLSGESEASLPANETSLYGAEEYERVAGVCGNGNTLYRRSAWTELPFDEAVRTAEDKLWIREMLRRGYRFAYVPMARAVNKNQASLSYMYHKGYRDARAMRPVGHRAMKAWQLAGALKNLTMRGIRGRIGFGNWARYTAHNFGQYFGSRATEDNTPINGAS